MIIAYKARLVAKGFSQVYGRDYFNTFAPASKMATTRLMMIIWVNLDLQLYQFDVTSAFLHAPLKEAVWIRMPNKQDGTKGDVVFCRIAQYGIKQSAHEWNKKITGVLTKIGLNQS